MTKILLIGIVVTSYVPTFLYAQTFTVLHTFHGPDGANPIGSLILDGVGNIYGTTGIGGSGAKCPYLSSFGCGTAFMLNKDGSEIALYGFSGPNGALPAAGLMRDTKGNFYGTTADGGLVNKQSCTSGCGVAFRLDRTGKEVLYQFKGTPDGFNPVAVPIEDSTGNFFGTTTLGGPPPGGLGTIFKIDATGGETILYSFTGGADGCFPVAGVILDAAGNLYGVADQGGSAFGNSGYGTVFKLDTTGHFSVTHTFGFGDGAYPDSVLLLDSEGNLYGTTSGGGDSSECLSITGCGTVFEMSPQKNGAWTERVLYSFCSLPGCADGLRPSGGLVQDASGNLYGTTIFGGTNRDCNGDACGVVFKLDSSNHETVLHSFTGGTDGADPESGLAMDGAGTLYGTTQTGGATCAALQSGCGVVFRIAP